jgi:excisionase family DNA binding protein
MTQELYSVEQVAGLLKLHVRTVRNYVREGRLKAIRIGKQYRVAREDLEAMTGKAAASLEPEPVRRERYVEVSSIVEIDAISGEAAGRMMTLLTSMANTRTGGDQPLRIESIYHEERARLKVILTGSLATNTSYLQFIAGFVEAHT